MKAIIIIAAIVIRCINLSAQTESNQIVEEDTGGLGKKNIPTKNTHQEKYQILQIIYNPYEGNINNSTNQKENQDKNWVVIEKNTNNLLPKTTNGNEFEESNNTRWIKIETNENTNKYKIITNNQIQVNLKSIDGSKDIQAYIYNKTDKDLNLYWINYYGELVFYRLIQAHSTYHQPTYVTHPWVIEDKNGKWIGDFIIR
jgi:hypothetical protein